MDKGRVTATDMATVEVLTAIEEDLEKGRETPALCLLRFWKQVLRMTPAQRVKLVEVLEEEVGTMNAAGDEPLY